MAPGMRVYVPCHPMHTAWQLFLGSAPRWYKQVILAFLLVNPILLAAAGPVVLGWVLLAEFILDRKSVV